MAPGGNLLRELQLRRCLPVRVQRVRTTGVRISELVDVEIEDFVPEGADEPVRLTGVPHPVNSSLAVAQASRSRVAAFGIELAGTGKNGHSAPFSWDG